MRGLVQRVSQASVSVDNQLIGEIDRGILLLLGVQKNDTRQQVDKLLQKVLNYRIFNDQQHKMNLSVSDIQGGLLVVSQFTLAAETQKGLRPGFSSAAEPSLAEGLYNYFIAQAEIQAQQKGLVISAGRFAANMQVSLINDGPVTFLLET